MLLKKGQFFMGDTPFEEAKAVLFGAPLEVTTSFRAGTRFGPQVIREVSYNLESYSPALARDLKEVPLHDAGDLVLPPGNPSLSLARIKDFALKVIEKGKFPVLLGGEHLVSYAFAQALSLKYPDLRVLSFDAHADFREKDEGEAFTHATVMRRIAELLGKKRLYLLGVRSGCAEEIALARKEAFLYPQDPKEALKLILPELQGLPLYLSFDIDLVDPAYAPGTGAPEPGGPSAREVLEALYLLKGQKIVGLDVVEVAPNRDLAERTALLAAKIVREALLAFCR